MIFSSIFHPFRCLGVVSSDVPFVVKYKPRSKEFNIAVPAGERFNVYKLPNLKYAGLSDCLPSDIRAFTSDRSFIYAAAGNSIFAFRGLRHVEFCLAGHTAAVVSLLAFGENFLASYDEIGKLVIWNLKSKEQICSDQLSLDTFAISSMLHPSNYNGKLLLGSIQGPLRLWNALSQKQIYWFKGFNCPVSCLAQSPAEDVCGIGLSDGRIILHNLRYDISLVSVAQDGGAITCIDFRSETAGLTSSETLKAAGIENIVDDTSNIYMVAGSSSGHLSTWQLENDGACKAVDKTEELHFARIVGLFCIPCGEASAAIVTCGADNCIKVSYMDRPDGGLRIAHTRSGHSLPPTKIVFWSGGSAGGSLLVSAGSDSQLRIFSTFNERFDKNLGRAYATGVPSKKRANAVARTPWLLPGGCQLAVSDARAYDWDSLAVVHSGRREVTTWNFVKATRGKHWLDPAKFHGLGGEALRLHKNTIATSLCMTRCGNFVIIGYSSGDVIKFNIQSGREYGSYGEPTAHESSLVGVHVNPVNRILSTVCEFEMKFWNFSSHKLISMMPMDSSCRLSRFHEDSDILAVALESGEICLINVISRSMFRRFPNPANHLCVDLTISSDATLLVSAHRGDPLIKTWDIVDLKLVDCFRVNHPVTSLALSPSDDLLATTHSGLLGVYLWDNRALYQRLHLRPLPVNYSPPIDADAVPLPTQSIGAPNLPTDAMSDVEFSSEEDEERREDDSVIYVSPGQLQDKLGTLSGLPNTYFKAFLQLDAIKKRNAAALVVPDDSKVELPFFLPVMETTTGVAWIDDDEAVELKDDALMPYGKGGEKNVLVRGQKRARDVTLDECIGSHLDSVLGDLISAELSDEVCEKYISRLKSLNPSALDLEIRLLAPSPDEFDAISSYLSSNAISVDPLKRICVFISLLINRLNHNLDLDFATACLESMLRRHGEIIARPRNLLLNRTNQSDFGETVANVTLDDILTGAETNKRELNLLGLVEEALLAKKSAQSALFGQITRSIALIDYIRNATCTLQM